MGLFNAPSPDAVRSRIQQEGRQSDLSYAAIPRGRGAVAAAAGAGRGLAQGLFGQQDPRLDRAQKLQKAQEMLIQSGLTPDDPQFYDVAADTLMGLGLNQEALNAKMKGAELARSLSKDDVDMRYKEASIANLQGKGTKAGSAIGKLVADYRAGLITKEQLDQSIIDLKGKGSTNVVVNNGGQSYKLPPGYMLKDPNDPSKGVTAIPGGPKDEVTGETAAKTQMLRTAEKQIDDIRSLVFDRSGEVNWGTVTSANVPLTGGSIPKTDGRKLATKMEFGIQAITRLETGAAMPPSEVENTRQRFQPTVGDTKEVVKVKLDMFEDFITGALKLLDPAGRFDEQRFKSELEKRLQGAESPSGNEKLTSDGMSADDLVKFYAGQK